MKREDRGSVAQLDRIARTLDRSVESLVTDCEGIGHFVGLLDLWPQLTEADRRAVLAFAHSRASRHPHSEPSTG